MRHRALKSIIHASEAVLGRRRLAQVARLLTNEVRLERWHDISDNVEMLVQAAALASSDSLVLDVGAHFGE